MPGGAPLSPDSGRLEEIKTADTERCLVCAGCWCLGAACIWTEGGRGGWTQGGPTHHFSAPRFGRNLEPVSWRDWASCRMDSYLIQLQADLSDKSTFGLLTFSQRSLGGCTGQALMVRFLEVAVLAESL